MHPAYIFLIPFFGFLGACGHLLRRLYVCPTVSQSGGKDTKMKIRFRYDNEFQTIEMNVEDAMGKWLSVDLEEDLTEEEIEKRVQEAVDEQYNRPEYNILHRETRHIDWKPKRKKLNGKAGYIQADPDDKGFNIMDYLLITSDEARCDEDLAYEEICSWVREILAKRPEWADMFICVRMDGESIKDYAERNGMSANSVSQKLKRAAKKLKEAYEKRHI